MVSVPSRGYLFFYFIISETVKRLPVRFRPLSGLSLFLLFPLFHQKQYMLKMFPSPLGVISFFTSTYQKAIQELEHFVSVPSRGYLFFTVAEMNREERTFLFPSPLGVISFFTILWAYLTGDCKRFPSPLGVISFFTKHN